MQVICLEDTAFYGLLERVIAYFKAASAQEKIQWINDVQAMQLLNIKSKTTLQKLRNQGKIRFSQPQKKVILYDRQSILDYLDSNARNTF